MAEPSANAGARRRTVRTIEIRDLHIAGIAAARKAMRRTRKVRHFEDFGLVVVDPWEA